ncbi:MAG: hydroxymethylbilane synthase [Acidobacteriota bacterium]
MKLRLGTRGSALALWQARFVAERLAQVHPGTQVETVIIKTSGDRFQSISLDRIATRGVFVKEIEEALLAGDIDLAVHSLKDLPTDLPAGLILAAFPERGDPSDALVSRGRARLQELPEGARVGTGSLRRLCQLKRRRPDLQVKDIRGNVDSRLAQVERGEIDAVVLATAGLQRLGRSDVISEAFSPIGFLPAVGQGCLAVEVRGSDERTCQLVAALNHPASQRAAQAERTLLAGLGGGCQVPIGAYAFEDQSTLRLKAFVSDADVCSWIEAESTGDDAVELGRDVARRLLEQGAARVLQQEIGR